LELQTGICHPASFTTVGLHFPAKEITFPFADAIEQGNDFLQYPIRIGPVRIAGDSAVRVSQDYQCRNHIKLVSIAPDRTMCAL
jgi:hypothetical protein